MTLNNYHCLEIKQHLLYRCKFFATKIFIQDIRILFDVLNNKFHNCNSKNQKFSKSLIPIMNQILIIVSNNLLLQFTYF